MMKKISYFLMVSVLFLSFISCATTIYKRTLVFNGTNGTLKIKETLSIKGDRFVFVKQSVKGKALFEGAFKKDGNKWEFRITHFKPANAIDRYFTHPIIYIYKVEGIPGGGVRFVSFDVKGPRSPLQFIMPGQFYHK